jgi:hypothetical protein
MSTTLKVIYSVQGVFLGAERDGQCYYLDRLDSFATEVVEGLRRFFKLLLIVAHFLKGQQKEYFCLAAVVDDRFLKLPICRCGR